jgi:hypothetical protein
VLRRFVSDLGEYQYLPSTIDGRNGKSEHPRGPGTREHGNITLSGPSGTQLTYYSHTVPAANASALGMVRQAV